jgi:hypothetical protein
MQCDLDSLNACGTKVGGQNYIPENTPQHRINTDLSTPNYQHRGLTHVWMHEHIFRHQLNAQTMNQTTPK